MQKSAPTVFDTRPVTPFAPNRKLRKKILRNWQLYIFIAPALLSILIFSYVPMYGIQIAFKNFIPVNGIWAVHGWASTISSGSSILIISGT
ncbi:hypothetical protein HMSSN139_01760 [Paenibacillus sp. HMSSN-139]|nr:hypothetical protein HMSSN139_01760 [Paenibacillus sp. HMSSN-139]